MDAPIVTTVDDLLSKLRAGIKEVYEITLRELTIPVRVLSVDEVNAIRREAVKHIAIGQGDETDKNLFIQKSTLKMASTVNQGGAPLLGDKLLSKLTVDEVNYLYSDYIRVMDQVNPSLDTISPEHFRALVEALKKTQVSAKELSLIQLRAICTAFVDLIQRQETATSQPVN